MDEYDAVTRKTWSSKITIFLSSMVISLTDIHIDWLFHYIVFFTYKKRKWVYYNIINMGGEGGYGAR